MVKLLDTTQAAEVLGLSPGTLTLWRHQGKGPVYIKVGASVKYRTEDLESWIDSRTVKPSDNRPGNRGRAVEV